MSKNLPEQHPTEEVDLGQLFKLIGNMFDRFFKFIGGLFNKLFLAFVWLVFFVKKHLIKLVIAGIIGFGLGFFKEKISAPVYESNLIVKQNYKTGENLNNSINYYNDLVKQADTLTLKEVLNITSNEASSILGFEMESVISDNQKLKNFDIYTKGLDSVLASTIEFKSYLNNSKEYNNQYQEITIKSKGRNNFALLFEKIVKNININTYFKREQEKDLTELNNRELALKVALVVSDSLQSTYKRVLEKVVDNKGSDIGITFEGSENIDKTKEFDLYKSDLELRRELVDIAREKEDKKHIIEVISSNQESGAADNSKEVFGKSLSNKLFYTIALVLIVFFILLGMNFIRYLERFKA